MRALKVDSDHEYGRMILANQQLSKSIKNWKWLTVAGLLAVLSYDVYTGIKASTQERPLIVDTMTGPIITSYEHVMDKFTVQERALVAKLAYEGLRRRVGNSAADASSLNDWGGMITKKALVAWDNLGDRWKDPHKIRHGFSRTIRSVSAKPDRSTPYAFIIDAIETDFEEGKERSEASYRVRLTLFFTDPEKDGVSRIEGVVLHSEEPV